MATNDPMIEVWNSDATAAWVTHPDRYDTMLEPFSTRLLDVARLDACERVGDIGCGSGALTRTAAERVGAGGHATGFDISAPLLDLARRRADEHEIDNVDFVEADAQSEELAGAPFDVLVSRFGVMFFADPLAAFRNLHASVVPSGRLAFAAWQPLGANQWAMVPVMAVIEHLGIPDTPGPGEPGPFAFGDADRVHAVLADAGWHDIAIEPMITALHVGGATTIDDAVAYYREDAFGKALFGAPDPDAERAADHALRDALAEYATPDGVWLEGAVWIVTATATDVLAS